jgi:hypothetical protein
MNSSLNLVLNVLLNKQDSLEKNNLLSFLEDSDKLEIEKKIDVIDLDLSVLFKKSLIDNIHYSWFIPLLNSYKKEEIDFFLLSLEDDKKKSLEKILNHKCKDFTISKEVKNFFLSLLYENLISSNSNLLPLNYLPKSNLSILLTLSKKNIVKIINYLSLYDLVKEVKYILDTKKLKKIYSFLSLDEKNFLNKIFKYQESFRTKRLNLEKNTLEKKTIRNILHKRGLERLALALSLEEENFIWYIMHFLDIGRACILEKLIKKEKSTIANIITSQILYIIDNMENL